MHDYDDYAKRKLDQTAPQSNNRPMLQKGMFSQYNTMAELLLLIKHMGARSRARTVLFPEQAYAFQLTFGMEMGGGCLPREQRRQGAKRPSEGSSMR